MLIGGKVQCGLRAGPSRKTDSPSTVSEKSVRSEVLLSVGLEPKASEQPVKKAEERRGEEQGSSVGLQPRAAEGEERGAARGRRGEGPSRG